MTHIILDAKLDPARFPNMSAKMGALVGLILEREYTSPVLSEVTITPLGVVVAMARDPASGHAQQVLIGMVSDLRANLRRLGMAAGLDRAEWAVFSERVRQRLGLDLDGVEPPASA